MSIRLIFFFSFTSLFFVDAYAVAYEIVELNPHKDSITFDESKNWYIVLIEEPDDSDDGKSRVRYYPLQERKVQIELINIEQYFRTDSVGFSDSLYFFKLIGDLEFVNAKFLIGTTDTLNNNITNRHFSQSTFDNLGFRHGLINQGIRSYSPYINLNIIGEVILDKHSLKTTKYEVLIDCDFDSYAYHKVISYGKNDIKSRASFTQSLNPLISEVLGEVNANESLRFSYSRIIHIGYIDSDAIQDFIIDVRGVRFLFLSHEHNFENQSIFKVENTWVTKSFYEF